MPTPQQRILLVLGGTAPPDVPVPVFGAELLTDGGLENWNSATDLTSWSETIAGSSTVNRDNTEQQAGTYCARLDVDSSNNLARIYQARSGLTLGAWYLATVYAKSSVNAKTFNITFPNGDVRTLTTSYQQFLLVRRADGATMDMTISRTSAASSSIYIDSVSAKTITLASMFSARPYSTHVTVKAQATITAGTRAGVVCNLDSATTPANFVIASHDGFTARLTKCVAGTYTELVSTAVTYVAGAYVEIRRAAGGDVWKLYYNGSQVGTDQTISDAAIKAATLAGMFNTWSGNSLSAFSCVPS